MSSEAVWQHIARSWHHEVTFLVLLAQLLYLAAMGPLRARYGWGPPVPPSKVLFFSLGMLAAFISEATPLHTLSEEYLFSAHMLQHVILTKVMIPLMILGMPDWALRPLLTWGPVAKVWRFCTSPVIALMLFNGVYTLWHMPYLYEAALWNHNIHILEHILMEVTAVFMWWPLTSPVPEFPRLPEPAQILYVFFMSVAQIGVFAVVTFSESVLYQFYQSAPLLLGISLEADQQLAGVVMKVGGMIIFLFVVTVVFFRWVRREGVFGGPSERLSEGRS